MIQHPLDVDLLIFDADGTLREWTVPGQPCPNQRGEWRLKPGWSRLQPNVQDVLRSHPLAYRDPEACGGIEVSIASNQAGVALGYVSHAAAGQLLWELLGAAMVAVLPAPGTMLIDPMRYQSAALLDYGLSVRWCPSHPDLLDMRRKPNPAMLWEAMAEHQVLPERSLMVGNRPEDELAAKRANVPFIWAAEFFNWGDCDA